MGRIEPAAARRPRRRLGRSSRYGCIGGRVSFSGPTSTPRSGWGHTGCFPSLLESHSHLRECREDESDSLASCGAVSHAPAESPRNARGVAMCAIPRDLLTSKWGNSGVGILVWRAHQRIELLWRYRPRTHGPCCWQVQVLEPSWDRLETPGSQLSIADIPAHYADVERVSRDPGTHC